MDTLIAILRGKMDQASDLQLIHHAEMGPLMFVYCTLCPGGQSALGPCINSLVHFVMYGYYGFTGVGLLPGLTKAVKPFITIFQMVQFVVLLVQSCFHLLPHNFNVYWDGRCVLLQFFLMLQMRACPKPRPLQTPPWATPTLMPRQNSPFTPSLQCTCSEAFLSGPTWAPPPRVTSPPSPPSKTNSSLFRQDNSPLQKLFGASKQDSKLGPWPVDPGPRGHPGDATASGPLALPASR